MNALTKFKEYIGAFCLSSTITMAGCTRHIQSTQSARGETSKPSITTGSTNMVSESQKSAGMQLAMGATSVTTMSTSLTMDQVKQIDSEIKDVYRCIDES